MRSKNAILNLVIFFIYEILIMGFGFIYPRFIILTYGSEINGLTATITRLLLLINLIQAGAVGTAIYQMYKPVAEENFEMQSSILYSSRRFYNKFLIIYITISIFIGLFYSIFLKSYTLSSIYIFIAFLILAANGAISLYFNSIFDIFISPHQKKYYLIISSMINQVVNYGLLTIVLIINLHFIFIYVAILFGGIAGVISNFMFYKKISKGRITSKPQNKDYKIPDRKYLMMTSIGNEVVTASPTVIISTIYGLAFSSVFSIYAMIFLPIKTLLNSIQLSISPIFGNLTRTSSDEEIFKTYDLVELITIIFGMILSTGTAFLLLPFINLYTNGITDINYVYPLLAMFVVIFIVFLTIKSSFSYVATVYGLFKKTGKIILSSSVMSVLISILLAYQFGMVYVMVGLIINEIVCSIATLLILKKNIDWFKTKNLMRRSIFMILIVLSTVYAYIMINPKVYSWYQWLISGLVLEIIIISIIFLYITIFETIQLRSILTYIKKLIKKI